MIEVQLINKASDNKIEIKLNSISKKILNVQLENKYDTQKKQIEIKSGEHTQIFDLSKMKGWYNILIKSENSSWYFAGRIESGKPTTTDPHWA